MWDRSYRSRLQADLLRWEAAGVITASTGEAIRGELSKVQQRLTISVVLAIAGGMLIAASFLAFVAANWSAIERPVRFGVLVAGIAFAYGAGVWFARSERNTLADLAAGVGSIIFGASIALVGQMYHLGDDFSSGLLLWAAGALVASAMTGSRAALAVALVVGCLWNGSRLFETFDIYLPFIGFWTLAALLSVLWNSLAARHLVAAAAIAGWASWALVAGWGAHGPPFFAFCAGISLLLGGGLFVASWGPDGLRLLGATCSHYAVLAFVIALTAGQYLPERGPTWLPGWCIALAAVAVALALIASVIKRSPGPVFVAVAIASGLSDLSFWARDLASEWLWLGYALALISALCIVISGMSADDRPHTAAGWIGLAGIVSVITWGATGSLLYRAAFLAIAGLIAIALASLFERAIRKEQRQ